MEGGGPSERHVLCIFFISAPPCGVLLPSSSIRLFKVCRRRFYAFIQFLLGIVRQIGCIRLPWSSFICTGFHHQVTEFYPQTHPSNFPRNTFDKTIFPGCDHGAERNASVDHVPSASALRNRSIRSRHRHPNRERDWQEKLKCEVLLF